MNHTVIDSDLSLFGQFSEPAMKNDKTAISQIFDSRISYFKATITIFEKFSLTL